ncbi:MAG: hypothetical protein Q9191_000988 [Dirinaria sp. TL-2023a]
MKSTILESRLILDKEQGQTPNDQDEMQHMSLNVTPDKQHRASGDSSMTPTAPTTPFVVQHGSEHLRQISFDLEQYGTSPFSPADPEASTPAKSTTSLFEKADELLGGRSGPFSPGSAHSRSAFATSQDGGLSTNLSVASQGSIGPVKILGRRRHLAPNKPAEQPSYRANGNEHETRDASLSATSRTEPASQSNPFITNTGSDIGKDGASAIFNEQTPGRDLAFDYDFPVAPHVSPTHGLGITLPAAETVHHHQTPITPRDPSEDTSSISASESKPSPLVISLPVRRKPVPEGERLLHPTTRTTPPLGQLIGTRTLSAENDSKDVTTEQHPADIPAVAQVPVPPTARTSSAHNQKSNSVSAIHPNSRYSSSVWVHEKIARLDKASRAKKPDATSPDATRPAHALLKSCSLDHLRPAPLSKHAHANEDDIHPALRSTPYFHPSDSVILSDEDAPGLSHQAAHSDEKCAADDVTKRQMDDTKPRHPRLPRAAYLQGKREAIADKSNAHLRQQTAEGLLEYEDTAGRMHTTSTAPSRPRKNHHATRSGGSYSGYHGPELAPTYEMNERLSSFVSSPDFHAQPSETELTPLRPRASSPTLGASSPVIYDPFVANPFQLAAAYMSPRPFNERSPSFKSDHTSTHVNPSERNPSSGSSQSPMYSYTRIIVPPSNSSKSDNSSQASESRKRASDIRPVATPAAGSSAEEAISRIDFGQGWPERKSSITTPRPPLAPPPPPIPRDRPVPHGGDSYNVDWEADGWWNPFNPTDPFLDPVTVPGRHTYALLPNIRTASPRRSAAPPSGVYAPTGAPGSNVPRPGNVRFASQDRDKKERFLNRKFSMTKVLKDGKEGVKKLLRRVKK